MVLLCSGLSVTLSHCSPSAQLVSCSPLVAMSCCEHFAVLSQICCTLTHSLCSHPLVMLSLPVFSACGENSCIFRFSQSLFLSGSHTHSLILFLRLMTYCEVLILYCVSLHTHTHTPTHSLSLVLVVMMKSKELKTKTSLTHSLILSLSRSVCLSGWGECCNWLAGRTTITHRAAR